MRGWLFSAMLVGLLVASNATAAAAGSATLSGTSGGLVARDSAIDGVHALDGVVVYHRADTMRPRKPNGSRPWMRIVDGRRRPARGMPAQAQASSIGRDVSGRVVLTASTYGKRVRWWVYDVAADVARPLLGLRSCRPGAVSVWRSRIAYFDDCPRNEQAVILQEGRRVRRFNAFSEPHFEQVALRGRSLAALGEMNEDMTIFRLLDRGRRCDTRIEAGAADGAFWAQELSIADGRLAWVMGLGDIFDPPLRYTHMAVMAVDLDGRCEEPATQRYLEIPESDTPVRAVTVDGRRLYYATEGGLYVHRLPARGSTAAPSNDDFEEATRLPGPLPLEVVGRVGHATLQPGEPTFTAGQGTVWYRFDPSVSERVNVDMTLGAFELSHRVLVGTQLGALTPLARSTDGGRYTFDAVAGQTYWIVMAAFSPPDYTPFKITISPARP